MLRFLESMQFMLFVFFTAAYAYQIVYLFVGLIGKGRGGRENAKLHRYAAVVAARNESAVIANLIRTLKEQNYPSELLDIYVIADNCTDNTAQISRQAGAYVYERFNKVQVGKGYALEYLFHHIFEDKGETAYDGFFVFDADNIVDRDFVREMNKMFDTGEYTALTSYRNSQNFCANWISAGYALWFLRESRFLNRPRTQLGVNCAVSGTGFLVSAQAVREDAGWPRTLSSPSPAQRAAAVSATAARQSSTTSSRRSSSSPGISVCAGARASIRSTRSIPALCCAAARAAAARVCPATTC